PSKRNKLRGFLKDPRHSLSDLFRSPSPTPSSSGALPPEDVAWASLKAALKVLRKSASLIPTLKSFADVLVDCVDDIP
ncbi:hypothetical protein FRC07_002631, partial [Ceratobasidium sp. 392]